MRRVGVLVLLLGLFLGVELEAQEKAGSKPLKIGVVDLGVLFHKFKKRAVLEERINAVKRDFEGKVKQMDKKLRMLEQQMGGLRGLKREQAEDHMKMMLAQRRVMKARMEKRLKGQLLGMTMALLKEINAEIVKYGKEGRYSFIFKVDKSGLGKESYQDRIFQSQVQAIPYFDKSFDVTAAVLERLNKSDDKDIEPVPVPIPEKKGEGKKEFREGSKRRVHFY